MNAPQPVSQVPPHPGHEALWEWFGLSRACWLTLPRTLMHSMPDDWQGRMAALLAEYDAAFPHQPDLCTRVAVTDHGGQRIPFPTWIVEYRHPHRETVDAMRPHPNEAAA